jgi:hypothetical protein
MNNKQNIVFFLGLILIVMVFWAHGYWTILWHGTIKPPSKKPSSSVTNPVNGKCPPGYKKVGNICVGPIGNAPPAFM